MSGHEFYTYKTYNSGSNNAVEHCATDGATLYGSINGTVVKITGDGTVTDPIISGLTNPRGITIAGGFLFVATSDGINVYNKTNYSSIRTISAYNGPQGITNDWDGSSNTFNIYVAHENVNSVGKIPIDITTIVSTGPSITGLNVDRNTYGITYRKYNNSKYIYLTSSAGVIQINVNTFNSYTLLTNVTGTGHPNLGYVWGITWSDNLSRFFIGKQNSTIYEFDINTQDGNGSISNGDNSTTFAFTYVGIILGSSNGSGSGNSSDIVNGGSGSASYCKKLIF